MEISSNSTGKVTIFITSSSGEVYRISSQELTNNTFVLSSSTIGTLNADTYTINVTQEEGTNHNAVTTATTEALTIAKVNVSQLVASTITAPTYTGEALTPSVTFTYAEKAVSTSEYTLVYSNNVNAGTNTGIITVTGNNINFTGETTINFSIAKANISSTTIADIPEQSFTGDEVKPTLTITYNGKTLIENTDYSLTYSNNNSIGIGTVVIEGITNFTGTTTKTFAIKQGLENATFSTIADVTYNKGTHTPTPTITLGETTLVKDTDYTISYSNNTNAGTATVTITGKGNYTGTASTTFTIKPATPDSFSEPGIYYFEGEQAKPNGGWAKDSEGNIIDGNWYTEDTTSNTYLTTTNGYKHSVDVEFISKDGNYYISTTVVDAIMYAVAYNGSTYYGTIEKALNAATSGNSVYVIIGTNPTIRSNTEIKSGVTLIIPFNGEMYNGRNRGEQGTSGDNYWFHNYTRVTTYNNSNYAVDYDSTGLSTAWLKNTVTIASEVQLTNNGNLYIGGVVGHVAQRPSGATSGYYTQIKMSYKSKIINNGTIECYGYIKEATQNSQSEVINESGTIEMPFVIWDYKGGTSTAGAYQGGPVIPFNTYDMPNIQPKLTIKYGSSLVGYCSLHTGSTSILGYNIAAKYNNTDFTVIGSSNALINLKSGGYAVIKYNPEKFGYTTEKSTTQLDLYGGATFGSMALTVDLGIPLIGNIDVETSELYFPINYKYNITLNGNGSSYDMSYKMKIMTGGTLTVGSGVTLNMNGEMIIYESYSDLSQIYKYPTGLSEGKLIVNGTLNVSGTLGGKVYSNEENAILNILAGATLSASNQEGDGTRDGTSFVLNNATVTTVSETATGKLTSLNGTEGNLVVNTVYMSDANKYWEVVEDYDSYTVTVYGNGGTIGGETSATYTYILRTGESKVLTSIAAAIPDYEHYSFTGWYTASSCDPTTKVSDTNKITVSDGSKVEVYAGWNPENYEITYIVVDDQGNEFTETYHTAGPESYTFNDSSLTFGTPYVDGDSTYKFYGWYTDIDRQNKFNYTSCTPDDIFNATKGTNTLYGYFSQEVVYSVSFDMNNEQVENAIGTFSSKEAIGGKTIDLSSEENNLKGFDKETGVSQYFTGWYYIDSNGTSIPFVSRTTIVEGNITLYANWEDKYYIIYNSTYLKYNGLTTAPTSTEDKTYYYYIPGNENTDLTHSVSYTGYTFNGWYSDSSFTTAVTNISTSSFTTKETNLYANLTANNFKITISANNSNREVKINNTVITSKTEMSIQFGTSVSIYIQYRNLLSGDSVTCTVNYDTGYSVSNGVYSNGSGTFYMPAQDITITFN